MFTMSITFSAGTLFNTFPHFILPDLLSKIFEFRVFPV